MRPGLRSAPENLGRTHDQPRANVYLKLGIHSRTQMAALRASDG